MSVTWTQALRDFEREELGTSHLTENLEVNDKRQFLASLLMLGRFHFKCPSYRTDRKYGSRMWAKQGKFAVRSHRSGRIIDVSKDTKPEWDEYFAVSDLLRDLYFTSLVRSPKGNMLFFGIFLYIGLGNKLNNIPASAKESKSLLKTAIENILRVEGYRGLTQPNEAETIKCLSQAFNNGSVDTAAPGYKHIFVECENPGEPLTAPPTLDTSEGRKALLNALSIEAPRTLKSASGEKARELESSLADVAEAMRYSGIVVKT